MLAIKRLVTAHPHRRWMTGRRLLVAAVAAAFLLGLFWWWWPWPRHKRKWIDATSEACAGAAARWCA